MRGLGADHVISGPLRGLKINITGRGHSWSVTDIATTRLNWPWGQFSENSLVYYEDLAFFIIFKTRSSEHDGRSKTTGSFDS